MARIATSIEESKRLLELGIDPKSADMYWFTSEMDGFYEKEHPKLWTGKPSVVISSHIISIPAWSLGKLFDIAWELDPNQVLSFQKGEKMDLIAIMVDFIEILVREVNTKGKEDKE